MQWDWTTELIGAEPPQFLVIIKNLPEMIKRQGGTTGALMYSLTPDTITDMVGKKLKSGFSDQGVEADVTRVTSPMKPIPPSTFLRGIGIGAVGVGLIWGLMHMLKGR